MSRIAITGSKGSLGAALLDKLQSLNMEVLEFDSSFRLHQDEYFESIETPENIDFLYHLAAATSVVDSWQDPVQFLEINTIGTAKVLEFCRKNKIELIFVSSYMYGIPQFLPINEEHPISVKNPYALSKKCAEDLCLFYGNNFDLNYNIVRPFNIYGNSLNKTLLIPQIIDQIQNSEQIQIRDLRPRRDYIFIEDVVDFLIANLSRIGKEVYNLGSGKSYSVAEIVDLCQKVWKTNHKVIAGDVQRKNEIPETLCDFSKAKKHLGWKPKFDMFEGLTKMKLEYLND